MKKRENKFHQQYEAIFHSDKRKVDQLADGFDLVLSRVLIESEREMDLLRAMGDRGGLIKEQIKHSTILHALEVFGECYQRATSLSWNRMGDQMEEELGNE